MKIAYLSTFYPFRGGIAHFNHSLIKAFSKNHDTKAFTFKRQYPGILFPGKTQMVTPEDKIEKLDAQQVLDTINPLTYVSSAHKLAAFNPDLLIMKYWMPFFAPSLGYVAGKLKKRGTKVISILDNVVPHERKFYDAPLSKYFLNRNSGFVAMSETVKADLLSLAPDAPYIMHAHPLYDHFGAVLPKEEARKKLEIPADKKVLLYFGFVRDYKGLDLLIEAFAKLNNDYYLIIAGEVYGDDQKYHNIIQKAGISNRCSVNLRYINDNEVPLFFSAADVNVLPYRSATQSGILSIAYHFELPVLVTDVGGLREAVEPIGSGEIIDKPDIDSISNAITQYFDHNRSQTYVENIRAYKVKNSWQALASHILGFAEEL